MDDRGCLTLWVNGGGVKRQLERGKVLAIILVRIFARDILMQVADEVTLYARYKFSHNIRIRPRR